MRVVLRPIGKNAWSGLIKYKSCYEDIGPYWTRSGRIYTGLTQNDEERLGKLLGLDLKSGSDFWKNFYIRTMGKDVYLDLEDPLDELRYLFLKNHKRVKNSLMENKATANFVIINKDEEAKRENTFNRARRQSIKEFDKLSSDDIRKCLRLFGHNADSMSNEVAENRLFNIVEANPQTFLDKWVNNPHRDTTVLIEKAVSKNIIRRNKNIYKYGSDVIGHNLAEAIAYLDDPKNQDIKIVIMKGLEGKDAIQRPPYTPIEEDKPEKVEPEIMILKETIDPVDMESADKARLKKVKKGDTI